jgi:hypothetical protein
VNLSFSFCSILCRASRKGLKVLDDLAAFPSGDPVWDTPRSVELPEKLRSLIKLKSQADCDTFCLRNDEVFHVLPEQVNALIGNFTASYLIALY